MKPEHRKFYFAFDADLDSTYELPYGMSYAKALKEQRPEIYQSFLSGWVDKILTTQEFPQKMCAQFSAHPDFPICVNVKGLCITFNSD